MDDDAIARIRCDACGTRQVKRHSRPYEYVVHYDKANPKTIRVDDLDVIECLNPQCSADSPDHALILDDAALSRLSVETYRQLGLLTPDEIRAGRRKLGMKQSEFQKLLGLGGNTLSRWEKGRYYQSRAMDLLMRLMFDCEAAREFATSRSGDETVSPVTSLPDNSRPSLRLRFPSLHEPQAPDRPVILARVFSPDSRANVRSRTA